MMPHTIAPRRRSHPLALLALLAAAAALGLALLKVTASPARGAFQGDAVVATVNKNAELVKTLQVGKKAGDRKQVVMTMPPGKLGGIQDGDRIDVSMEFEVTICLKPDPGFPGYPCVGKVYGYSPTIAAQIVIGPSPDSASDASTVPVTRRRKLTCSQVIPNRNRHCVLSLAAGGIDVDDAGALPCRPDDCHINVVAEAYNHGAKPGHKVVIGSSDQDLEINQNRASLNAVKIRPGSAGKPDPLLTKQRQARTVPVVDERDDIQEKVVYSIPIRDVEEGDMLFVDGLLVNRIGHLPYNSRIVNSIILADNPGATEPGPKAQKATRHQAELGKQNGSTCTKGRSGYTNPCHSRKVGAVVFENSVAETLHLNLITGGEAQILDGQNYRKGSKLRVAGKGFLRAFRFDPN